MLEEILSLDFKPLFLSFKLAFITTLILFIISLPLAWYLSQTKTRFKSFIETIVALPLVLPPSVLGFYILFALSSNSLIGSFFEKTFDIKLVFNFTGLVIASCIYTLPFMVQPLQSAFENIQKNIIEASFVCGKSKLETMFFVILPNIKPSLLSAIVISFAHTVGEFGIVLMIGGSIENETKVASIAIYEYVELLAYEKAHIYSAIMLSLSFLVLFLVYVFKQKKSLL